MPVATGDGEHQRALGVERMLAGDRERDAGKRQAARRLYRESLAIAEKLVRAEPSNVVYERDVFCVLTRLGDLARDDFAALKTERFHLEALAIIERLAEAAPLESGLQADLSLASSRVA